MHNQRIERFWGDLKTCRTLISFFRLIFIYLEEEYYFDIEDVIQFVQPALFIYGVDLKMFIENWNKHSIRTIEHRCKLWQVGVIANRYKADEE